MSWLRYQVITLQCQAFEHKLINVLLLHQVSDRGPEEINTMGVCSLHAFDDLIVSMKLFSSQSSNTIRAILTEAHNCEANAMLDSLLTVNPDSLQLLDDDCC